MYVCIYMSCFFNYVLAKKHVLKKKIFFEKFYFKKKESLSESVYGTFPDKPSLL